MMREGGRMELRQLRYFVSLAEELHFGKAAAREHIVQSALSQQIRRLEREIGVQLVERDTHHVRLTPAGSAMLGEVESVLRAVRRAVRTAQAAGTDTEIVRVSVLDASLDSMPIVLKHVSDSHPGLVVDRVEARVVSQFRMLTQGSLDVGFGNVTTAPVGIASELLRIDRLGVFLSDSNPMAAEDGIPLSVLADIPVVVADNVRGPEFNDFFVDFCERAPVQLVLHHGTVQSILAAASLVTQQRCAAIAPASCALDLRGVRWVPFVPTVQYSWSLMWSEDNNSGSVQAVRAAARFLRRRNGWLGPVDRPLREHRRIPA
jgi:DNA-binding transcriptional LysR family regulator